MEVNPDREWELLKSADITVHQERCAMVRNRNADCLRCAKVCTTGCISYVDGEVVVSPEKCIGCGTCASICPTCCLETHNPSDVELLDLCLAAARASGDGSVALACERTLAASERAFDETRVVRVGCLGRVEESLLANLAARGVEHVVLVQGGCDACPHESGRALAREVVETANRLFELWGSEMRVEMVRGLPAELLLEGPNEARGVEMSRPRGQRAGYEEPRRAETAEKVSYTKVMRDGTLPHFLPDRRASVLDALAELGEPAHDLLESRLWGHVEIDRDACLSCRMCAVFCPTGAIAKYDDEDGGLGIVHTPADCVACGSCEAICPGHAIRVVRSVYADELLEARSERYEMDERPFEPGNPHAILDTVRRYHEGVQIYER